MSLQISKSATVIAEAMTSKSFGSEEIPTLGLIMGSLVGKQDTSVSNVSLVSESTFAIVTPTFVQGPNPKLINHYDQAIFHGCGPSIIWHGIPTLTCPF